MTQPFEAVIDIGGERRLRQADIEVRGELQEGCASLNFDLIGGVLRLDILVANGYELSFALHRCRGFRCVVFVKLRLFLHNYNTYPRKD